MIVGAEVLECFGVAVADGSAAFELVLYGTASGPLLLREETAFGSSCAGPCWLPEPTCTSSKGSSGVAHGKITYQSRAPVAAARASEPVSLPQRPNGSFRQIQAYIAYAAFISAGMPASGLDWSRFTFAASWACTMRRW